jgi:hypothetical protein
MAEVVAIGIDLAIEDFYGRHGHQSVRTKG